MSHAQPRVVVADDAVILREGITQLLRSGGCEVVGTAGDIAELEQVLERAGSLDAVVLDIRMPPTHTDEGVAYLERLRAAGVRTGVLLLSMYASPSLAFRAMSAGPGTGYLLKDGIADRQVLADAVRAVAAGGTVVAPEVVAQLVAPASDRLDGLTPRERDVLTLMTEGKSNHGIAAILTLSPKTVETHVGAILAKLGLEGNRDEHRRVLAVLAALRAGFIDRRAP